MNSLKNRVQLIGHLGMNPEIKTLDSGTETSKILYGYKRLLQKCQR